MAIVPSRTPEATTARTVIGRASADTKSQEADLEATAEHQAKLTRTRTRLDNSQRIAGIGDWEYDFPHHRLLWSEEIYQILGIARKDFPPDSEMFYRQVHPEDLARVHREKKTAAEGLRRVDFEHRIIRPGGEIRHVHQVTGVTFDDQGQLTHESGTIQDITDRKLAEDALRQSEERYRMMFEHSPTPMWVFDPKTLEFLAVNAATLALYGYTREEFLRLSAQDIRPPEEVANFLRRTAMAPDEFRGADRSNHRNKDGTVFPVDILAQRIDFAGRPARLVLAVDRTATERAAAALRASEERFKFVARAVSDAVWDWNLLTNTVWWNEGFLTTFGYAAGEIEPSIECWTSHIHPEDRARVVESIQRTIASRAESWSAEYRFLRQDGSHAFVQDHGYVVRDSTGRGVRMVGGLRDLTEQKKMEAQYLRAQRMDSIGTLAGGIAHDLNNVLAPILMSIELLKQDPGNDPGRSKILETIFISCRRGADLVRQVLSFARGLDGQRVAIRLRHLIDDLESMISQTFPRNIQIVSHVPNNIWPVSGDPTQLHQVLLNLAVNARDAMPRGGKLTIATSNVTFDAEHAGAIPDAKPGPYVLLRVADTGMGIPPAVRDRIFDPFFTTKEQGKGTGIGLATVHAIVKSHGGFVTVQSEVGQGTTFIVYLPADLSLRSAATNHPFAPVDLPRGQNELILVVDDELSIREITQQTLEAFGYRVIVAADGADAIAQYAMRSAEIAAVITDMMMPIMDGADTINVIQRINPTAKIIAASGIDSKDTLSRIGTAGVKHFLAKPYSAETLLLLLRDVIDEPAPPAAPR